jgi:hypothetical protein
MTDLTNNDLDEIEQRATAATPGPWEAFIEERHAIGGDSFIRTGGLDDNQPDMYVSQYHGATSVKVPAADLDFIANARQDIPRLVAEIRRLRGQQEGGHPDN